MNAIRLTIDNSPSLPPWSSPNGEHITESIPLLDQPLSSPSARRSYFSNKENREQLKITEDQVWDLDFFNAYIDFDKFAVKLPGFEIGVMKYWDGQVSYARAFGGGPSPKGSERRVHINKLECVLSIYEHESI